MAKFKILIRLKNYDFYSKFIELTFELGFFTFKAMLIFIKWRQVFVEALILHHFDFKYYI